MTVDFYKCTDDTRTLNKNFTDKKTVTGAQIIGAMSMLSPVILLAYDSTLLPYQYAYIDTFARLYYVGDKVINTAGQIVLSLQLDALSSFSAAIASCPAQAIRSTSAGFTNVQDTSFPVDPSRSFVTSTLFDSGDLDPPAVLPDNPRRYILTLK